jgi:hypothetical protein
VCPPRPKVPSTYTPPGSAAMTERMVSASIAGVCVPNARGLHSFRFQLNLSSSVHRVTQLNSRMYPGVVQLEL